MIEIRDSTQAVANRTIELPRETQVGDYPTNQNTAPLLVFVCMGHWGQAVRKTGVSVAPKA